LDNISELIIFQNEKLGDPRDQRQIHNMKMEINPDQTTFPEIMDL